MYETFDHTADLGLRVRAADPEALFAEAARGLFSIIVEDLASVRARTTQSFRIPGADLEYLLFDWLSELLYQFEVQHQLLAEFEVALDPEGLSATASGEPLDPARHALAHEVKAITYHGLVVRQEPHEWVAELIVDI